MNITQGHSIRLQIFVATVLAASGSCSPSHKPSSRADAVQSNDALPHRARSSSDSEVAVNQGGPEDTNAPDMTSAEKSGDAVPASADSADSSDSQFVDVTTDVEPVGDADHVPAPDANESDVSDAVDVAEVTEVANVAEAVPPDSDDANADATNEYVPEIIDAAAQDDAGFADVLDDAADTDAASLPDAATVAACAPIGGGMTPGGTQMDGIAMLFCAPDNSACCVSNRTAVPCGWEACCDDPVGSAPAIPGIYISHPCATSLQPPPGYAKACLIDFIPFRTCTKERSEILAGTMPWGPCSSGGVCCPLDPGCEPKISKQLENSPPPKVDLSKPSDPNMKCDSYAHMLASASNASAHLFCKPGDQDCCWMYPPWGGYAPCGYDFCCQKDPSLPYGLTEANLTCAALDKLPQPVCVNNGTARYRHCNPSAELMAKATVCGPEAFSNIFTCCNGKSPGCENQPSVALPKAPWE